MQEMRKVAVIGGSRIPFCRSNTAYSQSSNQDMLTAALKGLKDKYDLADKQIGEVSAGAVLKHSWAWNLTRECVIGAGLDINTPACDLQMACGTSLQTALNLAGKIATGQIDSAIAAGTDTTSDAPITVSDNLRGMLLDLNRARSPQDQLKVMGRLRPKDLLPKLPGVNEPRTGLSMGQSCELMAKRWGVSREDQDQLAQESHAKAAAAYERGFYADLITAHAGVTVDNNLRPDTTLDKLATLKPAFDKTSGEGTLTAGNSTTLTDGASAVLLASEEWAKANNLPIQAYITYGKTAAVNYVDGSEGLLMAPAYAVSNMLKDADLDLQDFDIYEIHEAFAAQVLCTLAAWEDKQFCKDNLGRSKAMGKIDRSKMNPVGSSLAMGHPFAATGARIVASLAKQLEERGSGRGLISVCTAGGMGVAAILERP